MEETSGRATEEGSLSQDRHAIERPTYQNNTMDNQDDSIIILVGKRE